jgi:prolyl oligopeptidase
MGTTQSGDRSKPDRSRTAFLHLERWHPCPNVYHPAQGCDPSRTDPALCLWWIWVEQGGVYAIANIRGGSEYGKAWHEAGRRQNKQNVFDDFIAAGEYLKAQGITPQDGLAIQGGSNGGLLIGAVVNQRPDLFAAALPQVGVMDMLRFDQFTGGKLWLDEFGSPAREADFRNLFDYSPYHNIQSGKAYPTILATTADTDDRVVPGHTFKYVAALQAIAFGNSEAPAKLKAKLLQRNDT